MKNRSKAAALGLIVLCILVFIAANNRPYEQVSAAAEEAKLDMTFSEYISGYSGYLDRVALFKDQYDNLDYDEDGQRDRIYRTVFSESDNGGGCGYRIDFGNGDSLELGRFEDYFTAAELTGYDLTGDGANEIIFCGLHGASTFPPSGSEIAVFTKTDNGYEMLPLPRPNEWEDGQAYMTGYRVYIKNIDENKVTLYSTALNYEETVTVEDSLALDYFKQMGTEVVSSPAWGVQVKDYQGTPALVQYINIGYKYYFRNLLVYLTWQDGEFKPVHAELE